MKKVLVIAPAWVGDSVLAQPLYRRLHERYPGLELHVLAPPWTLPLLNRMSEVQDTLLNPFRHGELALQERWRLGRELARNKYDQAIVLPNSWKSALAPFFARIPRRTGFVGEKRYVLLNDVRKLDEDVLPLMVERFAQLAEDAGEPLLRPVASPRLTVDTSARNKTLAKLRIELEKPAVAFCPGAEYGPAKRWPAAYYAQLARALAAEGHDIWLIGSPKDEAIGHEIRALADGACHDFCGKTGLEEAIDLLSLAALVVTNDSGLMHIAAALDRPMIALYGSSSPGFTPPLSEKAKVLKLDLPC
ncbi:MAG TPA: lipopolysaccharide heptosyltransferase II, partial [Burkholderiales bacterium]|nr:lipopolysaccharide heptosyltransferase II [Burkholderiales bacterium]